MPTTATKDKNKGEGFSRIAMALLVAVATLIVAGLAIEAGTTLLTAQSSGAAVLGLVLVGLAAPCAVLFGVWVFNKTVL